MNDKIKSAQVLGSGCPACKKLFELTKQAVSELGLSVEVEYSSDIQKIIELGVMSSPVLVINGKVALSGQLPDLKTIKEMICNDIKSESSESANSCSCNNNC
jgi:small redox-active disulfide protein 2